MKTAAQGRRPLPAGPRQALAGMPAGLPRAQGTAPRRSMRDRMTRGGADAPGGKEGSAGGHDARPPHGRLRSRWSGGGPASAAPPEKKSPPSPRTVLLVFAVARELKPLQCRARRFLVLLAGEERGARILGAPPPRRPLRRKGSTSAPTVSATGGSIRAQAIAPGASGKSLRPAFSQAFRRRRADRQRSWPTPVLARARPPSGRPGCGRPTKSPA